MERVCVHAFVRFIVAVPAVLLAWVGAFWAQVYTHGRRFSLSHFLAFSYILRLLRFLVAQWHCTHVEHFMGALWFVDAFTHTGLPVSPRWAFSRVHSRVPFPSKDNACHFLVTSLSCLSSHTAFGVKSGTTAFISVRYYDNILPTTYSFACVLSSLLPSYIFHSCTMEELNRL